MLNYFSKFKKLISDISPTAFTELYPHEAGFKDYHHQSIAKIAKNLEFIRQTLLKQSQQAFISYGKIWLIFFLLFFIFTFTRFEVYYVYFSNKFNLGMINYHHWWQELPRWLKWVLPSKLIIWNFPRPYSWLIILSLFQIYKLVKPVIKYRNKVNSDLLYLITKFNGGKIEDAKLKSEVDFIDYNYLLKNNLLKDLILPKYDRSMHDKRSMFLQIDDVKCYYSKLELLNYLKKKVLFSDVVFRGLAVVIDIKTNLFNQQHIISANSTAKMANFMNNQDYNVSSSENIMIWHRDENIENLQLISDLADITQHFSKIINEHNKFSNDVRLDDLIANRIKRKLPFNKDVIIDKNIQLIVNPENTILLIPTNRTLFARKSIFESVINNDDVHLSLAVNSYVCDIVSKLKQYTHD